MYGTHLIDCIEHSKLNSDNTLHVIGVISNPVRFHSRYRIAKEWITHIAKTPHVILHMVESAYGHRQHELESLCQELQIDYLPLRTHSEAWIKESMINLGARRAIGSWNAKYLAWIDADVFFSDPNWAQEVLHQLQHFEVVQPWSDCLDLGPNGNVLQHFKSFGHQHQRRVPKQVHAGQRAYQYAHSGFAWAVTRRFWENTQGLMDFAILGSADHHMAFSMISEAKNTIHQGMHPNFFEACYEWQAKATRITHNEVGFVHGRIEHRFHGPKKRRYYRERWQILVDHQFDPETDLIRDSQGLIQLIGKPALEQAIKLYNRSRFEDSIEEI